MSSNQELDKKDFRYLKTAISLGKRNLGQTWPNPSVGCVIVKNNHIIGMGTTAFGGRPHAETIALKQAKAEAKNSTMYVTLEPCSHFGKTNPCIIEIIKAKINRLVCPLKDPNPEVNGSGFKLLKKNGIIVDNSPILLKEIRELNEGFISLIEKKRPFIALKLALSLNGKIATQTNKSNWITGEKSRNYVQLLRANYDAIIVGTETAYWDNPRLNLRDQFHDLPQPTKIIIDKKLRLLDQIISDRQSTTEKKIIVHDRKVKKDKFRNAKYSKIDFLGIPTKENDHIDLEILFRELANLGYTRILVEGGGKLATSLIKFKLVDKLFLFTAGILLDKSGIDGFKPLISDIVNLDKYNRYTLDRYKSFGNDILHIWNIDNKL